MVLLGLLSALLMVFFFSVIHGVAAVPSVLVLVTLPRVLLLLLLLLLLRGVILGNAPVFVISSCCPACADGCCRTPHLSYTRRKAGKQSRYIYPFSGAMDSQGTPSARQDNVTTPVLGVEKVI